MPCFLKIIFLRTRQSKGIQQTGVSGLERVMKKVCISTGNSEGTWSKVTVDVRSM
jgi:hypothetical protein